MMLGGPVADVEDGRRERPRQPHSRLCGLQTQPERREQLQRCLEVRPSLLVPAGGAHPHRRESSHADP
jgi:hypothetical protein